MSKAFTRESDDAPETPLRPLTPLAKDYLTPDGAQRLRAELDQLTKAPEPDATRSRIAQLQQILANAEVVQPPAPPWEQVLFGATVTVRDAAGGESRWRIVGREEADADRNWVSWSSPIARALLKTRVGQKVRFRIPVGEQTWEILAITFDV